MLDQLQHLAAKYADLQHKAAECAADTALRQHISSTLKRCLPASVISKDLVNRCFNTIHSLPIDDDPMHTGAIHAWAGLYLATNIGADHPLLKRLHHSALRLLPEARAATRDDLRLVTLDALYQPGLLPQGEHLAYLHHRLGLHETERLSCEEIALRMHKPLVYIHELESAILTILANNGGPYA